MDRYKKIKILKEGGFGKAYLAEDLQDNTLCVIKETKTHNMTPREIEEINREANILKVLKHPNIITFRDIFMDKKNRVSIAMDYADAGDLADLIEK
jgi:NIMA (never in mitosis gene a)-related kinase 1/4/5